MLVGLGAPVNNHQQCRKRRSQGTHSLLGGLGVVWGGENLIRIITPICAPHRGRDGMDCIGVGWMTRSINRSRHQSGGCSLSNACWARFSMEKKVFQWIQCSYIQYNVLCRSGQARMGGSRRMGSDDDFQIRQVVPVGARFCCWARWALFFIVNKLL